MTTVQLTYEERLGALDRKVEELQCGFREAVEHLRKTPEADDSLEEQWREIAQRMKDLREEVRAEDYDKDQLATLATAMLDIRDLLDEADPAGNLDLCDELMIRLERIRHVVRDALDEHVSGAAGDVGLVMEDIDRALPGISDRVIAALVGVDRRTLTRWRGGHGGRPKRDLRVFARLVAILRHSWDEEGIVAWFDRPRRDLGGRKPATLIDEPNAEEELIAAARSGRSQYGT